LIRGGCRRRGCRSCRGTGGDSPLATAYRLSYLCRVCRSIKTLRQAEVVASEDEIRAAARQFVRKVSGFREPSGKHQLAFEGAVDEIALASQRLLESIAENLPVRRAS
jgi:hypothetical protein